MAECLVRGADVRLISIDFAKAKIRKLYLLYVYLIHYPLRMYWEPIVLRRLLGDQMSDALGLISVAIIVGLTMVLTVAWDKWQTARRV